MTIVSLKIIRLVPLFVLPCVFWQLGNRQIFDDKVYEIIYKQDVLKTGHSILQSLGSANPFRMTYNSAPILVFIVLVLYRIKNWLWLFFYPESQTKEEEEEELLEGLVNYHDALNNTDLERIIIQEEYFRNENQDKWKGYGVKFYSDENYKQLIAASKHTDRDWKMYFQDCGTYRILDNIEYKQMFQYVQPDYNESGDGTGRLGHIKIYTDFNPDLDDEDQDNDPQQQDATYFAVNYAYCSKEIQSELNFDTKKGKWGGKSLFE